MTTSSNINFSGNDSYIQPALSGLAARQRVIANNVANVDTPGFKASEVRFEDVLNSAISRGKPASAVDQRALDSAASKSTHVDASSTRADGNNVDIDREMELMSEANLNYGALTQVMSTRLGILRNVITGGSH